MRPFRRLLLYASIINIIGITYIFRNVSISSLRLIRVHDTGKSCSKKWQSLSTEIPHGDTGGGHDCHELSASVM